MNTCSVKGATFVRLSETFFLRRKCQLGLYTLCGSDLQFSNHYYHQNL
jgi:hypothetical protein